MSVIPLPTCTSARVTTLDFIADLVILSANERQALVDRILLGRSFRAIGEEMGVCQSRVQQFERRALRKLGELTALHVVVGFLRAHQPTSEERLAA